MQSSIPVGADAPIRWRTTGVPSASTLATYVPLAIAIAILFAHMAVFSGWLVDDAAISLAYARNAADGLGLVHQPGAVPVEGFSNPSWTLLLAGLYALHLMVLPWTPKIIAFGCVSLTLWLLWRQLRGRMTGFWVAAPLVMLSCSSPFVIWTGSGLENALLALLVVGSCSLTLRGLDRPSMRLDVAAGLAAGLLAITRPDAILYALLHVPLMIAFSWGGVWWRRAIRHAAATGVGFALIAGNYFIFRWFYFHDIVPNTYHAKAQDPGSSLTSIGKIVDLWRGVFGDAFVLLLAFIALGVLMLVLKRDAVPRLTVIGAYLATAVISYLALPFDWMGEFRFATAVFPLAYWLLAEASIVVVEVAPRSTGLLKPAALVTGMATLVVFGARTADFARQPTFPMEDVSRYAAQGFDAMARGINSASLLTPDMGGVLLDSHLRIVDLAGLCDRTIARVLGTDTRALHEYIFGAQKPTFIRTHGPSLRITRLYDDPRFDRDYVAVHESWAPPDPQTWARLWSDTRSVPPWRGDYVRRDALGAVSIETLRARYHEAGMDGWEPASRPRDPFLDSPILLLWAVDVLN